MADDNAFNEEEGPDMLEMEDYDEADKEALEYMEQKAFLLASEYKCINPLEYPEKKMAMTQLFDAIAGSETGAILATTLVTPKFENNTAVRRPGNN